MEFFKKIIATSLSKFIIFFIFIILIIIAGLYFKYGNKKQLQTPITQGVKKTILNDTSKKDIENYYNIYKNPYVIYLRQALNAYLAHDSSQACIFQGAVDKRVDQGIVTGLDAFSKEYYKSKFVVVTIDDNSENGKDIQIIFQDKPDRIFYAWVGKNPYEEDCLLGFNSKEDFDKEENKENMKKLIEPYKPLIFDKEHAL